MSSHFLNAPDVLEVRDASSATVSMTPCWGELLQLFEAQSLAGVDYELTIPYSLILKVAPRSSQERDLVLSLPGFLEKT